MESILRLEEKCNQNCSFCNVTNHLEDYSLKSIMKRINSQESKTEKISISGGEPTLNPHLHKIIKILKNKGIRVSLQTNAMLLSYLPYVQRLKASGLDELFVSFHSHDKQISDGLTRTPDSWEKTVQGIKNSLSLNIPTTLNIVVNELNYKDLLSYVKFIKKDFGKIQNISFSFIQPVGEAWKNKFLVPKYSEVEKYLYECLDYCQKNDLSFANPFCGFPICYFEGYEDKSVEYYNTPPSNVEERKALYEINKNKVQGENCKECYYNDKCKGVWVWYAKIHGLDELKPIKC